MNKSSYCRAVIFLSSLVLLAGCGEQPNFQERSDRIFATFEAKGTPASARASEPTALRTVTINADDPASGTRIDPVNVWKDYNNRSAGVAGRVHHGDKVGLVRQDGGAALIRLNDGTQGWVNAQFVAELR